MASKNDGGMYIMKAGVPLILFCGLGVWVVANGIEGKNKERDLFQGRISKYVFPIQRLVEIRFGIASRLTGNS